MVEDRDGFINGLRRVVCVKQTLARSLEEYESKDWLSGLLMRSPGGAYVHTKNSLNSKSNHIPHRRFILSRKLNK